MDRRQGRLTREFVLFCGQLPSCKCHWAHVSHKAGDDMVKTIRRWSLAPVVALALSSSAFGQAYPNKSIRMVVPYPAGGVVDFVARQIGQKMADSMGQPVVVENRVGAGGTIATEATAKSTPDGYTVLVVFDTHAVNPHVYKNLRYDTFKDLAPVSLIA